jgi:hypothetical protein
MINCITFYGAFDLTLHGNSEKEDPENPGAFKGLLNYTSELDTVLKDHLIGPTVFVGTSANVQNELLVCILEVCREEISNEIQNAKFVSVIVNETSDVANTFKFAIVFRYELMTDLLKGSGDFLVHQRMM